MLLFYVLVLGGGYLVRQLEIGQCQLTDFDDAIFLNYIR